MRTDELEYELPERLIATRPAVPRDSSRLLVYRRDDEQVEHRTMADLPEYLSADDLLVFNESSVVPARFEGVRPDSGGRVEGLFVEEIELGRWRVMLRSNGRLRAGLQVAISTHTLDLEQPADGGQWIVSVSPPRPFLEVLQAVGRTPLPPYIIRARGEDAVEDAEDRRWYETVYADPAARRSVAAPTAGLHFTPELLATLDAAGVRRTAVRLHVGPGTFKPITADEVETHQLDAEHYEVPPETLSAIRDLGGSGRLVAVGTTTVRTLESLPDPLPGDPVYGRTELLISPPYRFRHVQALLTNFHLPRSSLLALVAALIGLDRLLELYREAVAREYRFYSYGDAMLIL
jgi:S-adenosylmethionine:tRNA ribosyltransferase-isomerase